MSISDFDVEPVVGPRSWAVLLGLASAVTGILAVIGWPLPVVAGRGSPDRDAWARTVAGVHDWLGHDGWRMSGTSWIWGAAAVAAVTGIVVVLHPTWPTRRSVLVVVAPAAVLLVLGPTVQWALSVPWSNYGAGSTGDMALAIVVAAGIGTLAALVRRAVHRGARAHDEGDVPSRGLR